MPGDAGRGSWVRRPVAWAAALGLCTALVSFSFFFVDRPVSRFAHDVIGRHPLVHEVQKFPEFLAQVSVALVAGLGLLRLFRGPCVFRGSLGRLARTLFTAGLSLMVGSTMAYYLKPLFGRTWPETFVQNNPSFIDNGVYGFFWFHGGAGWSSFPSGHMVVASAFLVVVARAHRRAAIACALLLLVEGLALLAMDYHFVGDIIGGLFLGGGIAVATSALAGLDETEAA